MLLELSDACENNITSVISHPETSQMLNIAVVSSHWLIYAVSDSFTWELLYADEYLATTAD